VFYVDVSEEGGNVNPYWEDFAFIINTINIQAVSEIHTLEPSIYPT
jgi:hypothetical protein